METSVSFASALCDIAGRADYYGSLPNLAARVMALAAPGQILVEESGLIKEDKDQIFRLPKGPPNMPESHEPIELELLGNYYLKASTLSPPVQAKIYFLSLGR